MYVYHNGQAPTAAPSTKTPAALSVTHPKMSYVMDLATVTAQRVSDTPTATHTTAPVNATKAGVMKTANSTPECAPSYVPHVLDQAKTSVTIVSTVQTPSDVISDTPSSTHMECVSANNGGPVKTVPSGKESATTSVTAAGDLAQITATVA